jgi:hypothetical protein
MENANVQVNLLDRGFLTFVMNVSASINLSYSNYSNMIEKNYM